MDVCDRPALPYTTMLASLLLEGSQQAQKEIDSLVGALRAGLPWFWSEPNKRSKEDHHHHRHDSPQRQQSLRAALVSSGVVDGVGIWKTRLLSSVSVIQFGGVAAAALSCMSPQVCMQLLGQVHCCCRHSRDRSFYSQEQLHVKIACHVACQPCTRLGFFIAKLSAWCMPLLPCAFSCMQPPQLRLSASFAAAQTPCRVPGRQQQRMRGVPITVQLHFFSFCPCVNLHHACRALAAATSTRESAWPTCSPRCLTLP